jgi:uncharacterized ion transporter superfamily protein YfcC
VEIPDDRQNGLVEFYCCSIYYVIGFQEQVKNATKIITSSPKKEERKKRVTTNKSERFEERKVQ